MLCSNGSSIEETYYDILSVREDASYDEIRAGYKVAILNTHPDKFCGNEQEQTLPALSSNERFLMVQKAWQILGNSQSRATYDQELIASRLDVVAYAEVGLEEMTVDSSSEVLEFLHPCRCGDYYAISSADLEEMGFSLDEDGKLKKSIAREFRAEAKSVIIPCGSCSLKILAIVDPNH